MTSKRNVNFLFVLYVCTEIGQFSRISSFALDRLGYMKYTENSLSDSRITHYVNLDRLSQGALGKNK